MSTRRGFSPPVVRPADSDVLNFLLDVAKRNIQYRVVPGHDLACHADGLTMRAGQDHARALHFVLHTEPR